MDAATLLITNALLSSAAALVMLVVLRTRKTYAGFGFWAAGVGCLALGAAMLIPGALPSGAATRVGRNAMLIAGHLLLLRGMLVFRGIRASAALEIVVGLLFLTPFTYLSLDGAALSARIVCYCLFSGVLNLTTVVITLRRRPPHFGSNDVLLALWLLIFATVTFGRAAQELSDVSTAFEAIKGLGSVYALAQVLSLQLVTLTLVSMNSQRIEWELRDSATALQGRELQLRSIGDNLPAGFVYRYENVGGQRRFSHVSGGIEGALGLKPTDVIANAGRLFALLAPDARARYATEEARSQAELSDHHTRLRLQRADGQARWLELRAHPQRRPDGSTFWDGVALDVTERRRAEEDLHRYKSLVDFSEDAIISKTLDGTVTSWNRGAERLFGYAADEAIGRFIGFVVPPELAGEERDIRQRIQQGEVIAHFETTRLHRDGRRLTLSVAVSPIGDPEGRVVGASTIARDISERLQARAREQRLARFYLCLSQCNEAVARCATQAALFDAICRAIIDAAGMRLVWVSLVDASGALQVQALAGAPADFPERMHRLATAAPTAAEDPATLAMRSGEPVWCQDFETHALTREWHLRDPQAGFRAAASLPVRRASQLIGALTICAGETQAFDAETRRLLVDLAANIRFALDNFDREAARREAQDALHAHRQQLEETVERRTRQLAEASQRAEAANVAKSAFLANMSHEIRTPLNAMLGMAHLIRQEGLSPRQADRLQKLDSAAKHLLDVLNAVLDLSKIEAGKLALVEVPLNVPAIVEQVRSMMAERAEAKQLQLSASADDMPADLVGDPTRLQQALLNYAQNAVKFTAAGRIEIRARLLESGSGGALLRFEVQDTGIGVSAEALPRLFAPFEQADVSSTRRTDGTGLGLAITRKLAALMGGDTGVESVPGEGSTFWFTARLRRAAAAMPPAANAAEGQPSDEIRRRHAGAAVLLAEDNPVNAEVAQVLLEDLGLHVDIAVDGEEAVRKVGQGRYRLVLMDMQMPRMDGVAACRAIRQRPDAAALPIVAMTANAFAEDRAVCLAAGMNDFVSKPVDPPQLYRVLLRWLDAALDDVSLPTTGAR